MEKKILGGKVEIIGGSKKFRDEFANGLENYIAKELDKEELDKKELDKEELLKYKAQTIDSLKKIRDILKYISEAYDKAVFPAYIAAFNSISKQEQLDNYIKDINKMTNSVKRTLKALKLF